MTKIINWTNSISLSHDTDSEEYINEDFLYDYSAEFDSNEFFNTSEEESYEFISTDSLILDLDLEIQKYLEKKVEENKLKKQSDMVVDNYSDINIRQNSEIPKITIPKKNIIKFTPTKPLSFDDVINEMKNRKPRMDFIYQIIWMDQINKEIRGFKKDKLKHVISSLKEKEYSWFETITSYFW